jgi:hypothetical protein
MARSVTRFFQGSQLLDLCLSPLRARRSFGDRLVSARIPFSALDKTTLWYYHLVVPSLVFMDPVVEEVYPMVIAKVFQEQTHERWWLAEFLVFSYRLKAADRCWLCKRALRQRF